MRFLTYFELFVAMLILTIIAALLGDWLMTGGCGLLCVANFLASKDIDQIG